MNIEQQPHSANAICRIHYTFCHGGNSSCWAFCDCFPPSLMYLWCQRHNRTHNGRPLSKQLRLFPWIFQKFGWNFGCIRVQSLFNRIAGHVLGLCVCSLSLLALSVTSLASLISRSPTLSVSHCIACFASAFVSHRINKSQNLSGMKHDIYELNIIQSLRLPLSPNEPTANEWRKWKNKNNNNRREKEWTKRRNKFSHLCKITGTGSVGSTLSPIKRAYTYTPTPT